MKDRHSLNNRRFDRASLISQKGNETSDNTHKIYVQVFPAHIPS